LLYLAEHVAPDRPVLGAVHPVVLLLLHREVRPQDLLERVLLLGLGERVVRAVMRDRLVVQRLPGQFLDLLMGLRDALPTHVLSPRSMSDGLRPMKRPGSDSCGLTMRRRSLLPEDGRTQLGQAILDIPGHLTIALGGRLDAERPQQRGGMRCRVAVVAEDGVKAVVGQVMEDEVDHGPRIEGLRLVGRLRGEPARRPGSWIGHDTRLPVGALLVSRYRSTHPRGGAASQFETGALDATPIVGGPGAEEVVACVHGHQYLPTATVSPSTVSASSRPSPPTA